MNRSTPAEFAIGTALGSPSHLPVTESDENAVAYGRAMTESPDTLNAGEDIWRIQPPLTKPKASKWKSIGEMFGKRNPKLTRSFYQLQHDRTGAEVVVDVSVQPDHRFPSPPPQSIPRPKSRARSRANSERLGMLPRLGIRRAATGPMEHTNTSGSGWSTTPTIRVDGSLMLNVDIPDVHMERYSVMFGSVLQAGGLGSRTSLLARRQGTLEKLKVINDSIAEEERLEDEAVQHILRMRRATSPSVQKSPSFTLYPKSQAQTTTTQSSIELIPQRLNRSNTSPAVLTPHRQTFDVSTSRPLTRHQAATVTAVVASPKHSTSPSEPRSPYSDSSLDSLASSIEYHDALSSRPRFEEPEWEMVTKPGARSLPTPPTSTSSNGSLGLTRTMHSHQTTSPPRVVDNFSMPDRGLKQHGSRDSAFRPPEAIDDLGHGGHTPKSLPDPIGTYRPSQDTVRSAEEAAAAESAASISIARQISLSQRQRQLLVPIIEPLRPRKPRASTLSTWNGKPALPQPHYMPPKAEIRGSELRAPSYEEPHPGTKVILPPERLRLNTLLNFDLESYRIDGGLAPPPIHQNPLKSSPILPNRKTGSVRTARKAIAGISNSQGEIVLGVDGHGLAIPNGVGIAQAVSGERVQLKERKLSTPTYVMIGDADGHLGVPSNGARGHAYKRSEQIVLEHA